MENKISARQALVNKIMRMLPEVKEKKEHVMKKGESLWGLAQRELGTSKNEDIRNYMLLIAKLNNLDTIEKMNSLKVNEKIYLPSVEEGKEGIKAVDLKKPQPKAKSAATNPQAKAPETKPQQAAATTNKAKEKTNLELTTESILDILENDKTIFIRKASVFRNNAYFIFHEKKYETGWVSRQSPVAFFALDKNGKIEELSFEGCKDLWSYGMDYKMDRNGNTIFKGKPFDKPEKIDEQTRKVLFDKIEQTYNKLAEANQIR